MDALAFIGGRAFHPVVGPKAAFLPKGTRIAIVYLALRRTGASLALHKGLSQVHTRNHRSCARPDARCDNACAARGVCKAKKKQWR